MDFTAMDILDSVFRWFHVFFGILWIGLLYFFNWVNGQFSATMDAETKKKVVPELMPRALFWFRMGALFTWITGFLLLLMVFYHSRVTLAPGSDWSVGAIVMIVLTFVSVFIYDALTKSVKNPKVLAAVGFLLIALAAFLYNNFAGFSYRGTVIHVGVMFGSIMAYNVWFRIWPNQQKIITAVKNGQAPDAGWVGVAGLRSRHNTFLSIPLVWTMINAHHTYLAPHWWTVLIVVALGWKLAGHVYSKAGKIKGF